MTAVGVAVVRSWLQVAADNAIDATHGLERWCALRHRQLRRWWLNRRGRPPVVHRMTLTAAQATEAALDLKVSRRRVKRETVSEREWLAFLDDRVESIFELMDEAERNLAHERDDINRRLAAQRNELRAEIQRETRQAGS